MSDRRICRLRDFVTLQRGYDLPSQDRFPGSVPVMGGGGQNGFHNSANVRGPGVLLGRSGAGFGSAWWCEQDFWAHNTALFVTNFHGNNPRFVYYFLDYLDFSKFNSGGAQPSLNRNFIYPIEVQIPPLREQLRIVDILYTWDEAIEKNENLIAAKESIKRQQMEQLLRPCCDDGCGRWPVVHLGNLFTERAERATVNERLLAVTASRGVIDRDELKKRDTSSDDKSTYKLILPGDIGYNTMRMWQGVSGLSGLRGIVSPAYTVCTPNPHRIDGEFAAFLFKLPRMIFQFWRYSQGLVDDTLSLKFPNFAQIRIRLPDIRTQREIVSALRARVTELATLHQLTNQYRRQKRGLMQKLLTGEWKAASDIDDEGVAKEVAE